MIVILQAVMTASSDPLATVDRRAEQSVSFSTTWPCPEDVTMVRYAADIAPVCKLSLDPSCASCRSDHYDFQIDKDGDDEYRQSQHWLAWRRAVQGAMEAQPCPTGILTLVSDALSCRGC